MNDREKWREVSEIAALAARHDDDDIYISLFTSYTCFNLN